MVRLLRSLPGVDRVVARGDALPHFDLQCPMLSLPLALGTASLADIPATMPYLFADTAQVAGWRARLDALGRPEPRVGLVWAGNPRRQEPIGAAVDRRRSIPPAQFAPLFALPGVHFVSLQKDGPAAPSGCPLTDFMGEVGDFADTAALVANLDLVISVDTSVAHLAAALGKPVWLLDRSDPCWRWLVGRRDCPWYPTVRIYRQPHPGDWDAVVDSVRADLGAFAGDRFAAGVGGGDGPGPVLSPDTVPLSVLADVRGLFGDAVRHHQSGRLAEAEHVYRQVLAVDPRHADSLHLLGVIGGQTARHDLAADMISRAIAIRPNEAPYHCNLGIALRQLDRLDEAVRHFRIAIDLKPDHAEAHNHLGVALKDQGRLDEAIACYRRAVELLPAYTGAHNNLGIALKEQGRVEEAVASYRRAIELEPNYTGAHNNLGLALKDQGRPEEAEACFRRAIALNPNYALAYCNLGIVLQEQGRLDEAAACFGRALELNPGFAEAHNNLGTVLGELGRQDEAMACYRAAIDLMPGFPEAHNNLGTALRALQRLDEALGCYRQAIALSPDYADAHNNLAMTLLARGDMAAGWAEYEWRWRTPAVARLRRDFAQPQWRGEPAEGRTLLVHAEQGFGDTLQFCRFVPLAAARGWCVVLEVPGPLVRLLRGLPGIAQMVATGEALPPFDLHCPMLSLPLALGSDSASIPGEVPYLHADTAQVAAWQARLAAMGEPGRRVGLVWAGSSRSHAPTGAALDARRSIAPERLGPVVGLPGLQFFSLQKDGPAAPAGFRLTDCMGEMGDFADTAALVANLDLVIAVDTSVAHLAAALGKPVWLLDRSDPCWRWMLGRRDSPWYPALRIYRQPRPGDWDSVIESVRTDLARCVEDGLAPGGFLPLPLREGVGGRGPVPHGTPPPYPLPQGEGESTARDDLAVSSRPGRPPPDIRALFDAAVQHHRAGRLADAEALYRDVLAANPRHADSLHLLGVISGQTGRHELAADMISQAIEIDPRQAAYHSNLAISLKQQERLAEAVACFRTAVDLGPGDPEAHIHLGIALKEQWGLEEAVACFRRAIELRPDAPRAHYNLGNAVREQGLPDEAAACYRRALALQPDYDEARRNLDHVLGSLGEVLGEPGQPGGGRVAAEPEPVDGQAHNNLGIALQAQGRLDQAVAAYRQAVALDPDLAEAHNNLGTALREQGRPDEAAACYRRAIELRPDYPEAHNNLGNALRALGRLDEAIACLRRALALKPDYPHAHNNLGIALQEQGLLDEAIASCRTAVALNPASADARTNLGMALLARGDLPAGWEQNEWRWQTPQMSKSRRDFVQPQWRGEAAEGRTLLIHAEQGMGDTLQFCRYAPLAAARGLRVILEVPRPLVRLLRSLPDVAQVVEHGEVLPDFDLHCPMLSMPLALGTTIETIPNAVPYLRADSAQVAAWRARLAELEGPGEAAAAVASSPSSSSVSPPPSSSAPPSHSSWRAEARHPRLSFAPRQEVVDGGPSPAMTGRAAGHAAAGATGHVTEGAGAMAAAGASEPDAGASRLPRIGLVWAGNPRKEVVAGAALDRRRSIAPDRLAPLFRVSGARLFSLQKDGPAAPEHFPLIDHMGEMEDFADTAALVANLDLVISVDTSVAHLAGAMGKPVWLLDRFDPDWRWLAGRRDSPWYPTLRIYRQPHAGDWDSVIDSVRAELGLFISDRLIPASPPDRLWPRLPPDIPPRLAPDRVPPGLPPHNPSVVAPDHVPPSLAPDNPCSVAPDNPPGVAPDLRAVFAEAVRQHQAGHLADAEHLYRDVLAANPGHADSLHLLGVIGGQTGRHDLAADLISQAIAVNPNEPAFHSNLGISLKQQGRLDEAVACFRTGVDLKPNDPEAHNHLGIALKDQGRLDEAAASYRRALELRPDFPRAHHNLGNVLWEQGRLEAAARSYRRALEFEPDYAEALKNLGNVLWDLGQFDEAAVCYRRAIELKPDYAEALNDLGNALRLQGRPAEAAARDAAVRPDDAEAQFKLGVALRAQGRTEEAIVCYRQAVMLRPDYPVAHNNLGNALRSLGRMDEAVASLRRAVELRPDYAEAHNNLGIALQALGRRAEAVAAYRRALELRPDTPEILNNLGTALQEQARLDEAVACYRRAIDLDPGFGEAHNSLGAALQEQGRPAEAADCYRRAIALKPDHTGALNNLGTALQEQGLLDEATVACRRAIDLAPDFGEAHNSLGTTLLEQGQLDEAVACYRRALELNPDYADAHCNLAMALLARGELAAGWAENEWRWKTPQLATGFRGFSQPQWRGEPAEGQTLLIHAEQGFGDNLQFCRYASLAAEHGLKVIVEVPKPLARLFRSLRGVAQVVTDGDAMPAFDLYCPMLSLPLALETSSIAAIPCAVPYLHAHAAQVADWRARLGAMDNHGPRIGLVWAGNPREHMPSGSAVDRRRSIGPERLAPLFEVPGLHFFSLQKGGAPAPADYKVTDFMSEMVDFADTAALVANLDLVISVDTSVAHLAGALGKPVWLLDRFDSCWRWLVGRHDSPWYPTLRLFRQPRPGDWGSVVEEVVRDLHGFGAG